MNILIVTQYFWPENFRINDLALGLRERGHSVVILTGKPNYPGGKFFSGYGFWSRSRDDYQGIPVLRVPLVPRGKGGGWRLAVNYFSFVLFATLAAPFRCNGSYDLIFVYEPSPITVALPAMALRWMKGAPLMFWVQDLWPESLSATGAVQARWILRLVERLVRFIYRRCDRILIQSRSFAQPVAALGADPARIRYFPNTAESLYRPVQTGPGSPGEQPLPQGFRVMFAGNLGGAQDFETILAAALRLKHQPEIHWVVLGDGRMGDWIAAQVEKHALQGTFHLLGRFPVEMMPRFFARADVMLVTLGKAPIFALTIPAKIQSYLACARPVVAALDGEGARIIEEAGAGLAVPAEDPAALANAVQQLYRMSPGERQAMGARGRAYFEQHFEREMLLNRLELWMKELTPVT